jgi:hypothetical protein
MPENGYYNFTMKYTSYTGPTGVEDKEQTYCSCEEPRKGIKEGDKRICPFCVKEIRPKDPPSVGGGWEERFNTEIEHPYLLSENLGPGCAKKIKAFIRRVEAEAEARGREKAEKLYAPIFDWLYGVNGEFPDLSQKPHYRFRTELRKRLDAARKPNDGTV